MDEDRGEATSRNDPKGSAGSKAVVGTASDVGAQFRKPSGGQSSSDFRAPGWGSGGDQPQTGWSTSRVDTGGTRVDPTLDPRFRFVQRSGWMGYVPDWEEVLNETGKVPYWYLTLQKDVATSGRWRDAAFDRCD